jgi:hypothetical protein
VQFCWEVEKLDQKQEYTKGINAEEKLKVVRITWGQRIA